MTIAACSALTAMYHAHRFKIQAKLKLHHYPNLGDVDIHGKLCFVHPLKSTQARDKSRSSGHIAPVSLAELRQNLSLLPAREFDVHVNQYGKHHESRDRRPLEKEAKHDQHKSSILRMTHVSVRTACR